ncbi:hypothetical protein GJV26_10655 [Massilia dura]|uniref:Uncharacterized protein n=1 Tax=Pseudoduganella dura TaxID=321982 RepID=A0A6I3X807_9BURK|nr:hypothetical protein [Pseudoduganella dura]MUI12914.1 hypothetical protein [Pseudoduganella dura]GGX88610.1 hypothetical protein GCM10007386_19430 [Pseudoduganella dura]
MKNEHFAEARADSRMAQCVDTGVKVSMADGVTPALEFMLKSGVPREVAMRVLSGPRFIRHPSPSGEGAPG